MEKTNEDDFIAVNDLIHGFAKSQWLFAAVELGIFAEIEKKDKSVSPDDMASCLELDPSATSRLMNACASIELLHKNENGTFENTGKSRLLLEDTPRNLLGVARSNKASHYDIIKYLDQAVKTGKNQAKMSLGVEGDQQYSQSGGYYRDKGATYNFMSCMHGLSAIYADKAVRLFNLKQFRKACDLGGGSGVFGYALSMAYPDMEIIYFDLPSVLALSEEFKPPDTHCKVTKQPGDFFKDELPQCDLYLTCHVLHDWSEEKAKILLLKVFKALSPGGAVLLVDYCLNRNKVGPVFANIVDMNQLASVEGRMRTTTEWMELFQTAGFINFETRDSASYFGDIMIAFKPNH